MTPLSQQVQLIDNSCQTDPTPTNSLVEELESGFDDFDMRSITTADTAHPPSYGDQEEGEASSPRGSKGSPNFSFQEYIRLKRENLSLRVMVSASISSCSHLWLVGQYDKLKFESKGGVSVKSFFPSTLCPKFISSSANSSTLRLLNEY